MSLEGWLGVEVNDSELKKDLTLKDQAGLLYENVPLTPWWRVDCTMNEKKSIWNLIRSAWLHSSDDGYVYGHELGMLIKLDIIYFLHFEQREIDKAGLFYSAELRTVC